MTMATPFGRVVAITPLVTLLVICTCDLVISLDNNRPVDPVQFLLTEGEPVDKVVPLPYGINLHCELILGIEIEPFLPQKQEDYEDYEEYDDGSGLTPAPAREAGEVLFALQHPNFQGGEQQIIVSVDEKGNGLEKETICFIECANITGHKTFTLRATTDLKSTVDVKLIQKVLNHACQYNLLASLAIPSICLAVIFFITTIISFTIIYFKVIKESRKDNIEDDNAEAHPLNPVSSSEDVPPKTLEENELPQAGTEEPVDINAKPMDATGELGTGGIKSGKPSAPGSGWNHPRDKPEKHPEPVDGIENGTKDTTKSPDTAAPKTKTWNNWLKKLREKHMILLITCVISLSCTFVFAILSVLSLI